MRPEPVGNVSITKVDNSASGAVYKGLAIGQSATGWVLYAANFASGKIDVFNSNFVQLTPAVGRFTDPGLPAGYAPFNVQVLNGKLYVTYALRSGIDDVPGAGNGFVDVFDLDGGNLRRVVSNGLLNSPWGLDIAPAGFGAYANDLLVGNFGDGTINVYDPNATDSLIGTLMGGNGAALHIDGLWGLINGNGTGTGALPGGSGVVGAVYFTAGIGDEEHGLFGSLLATPEPSTLALFGAGLLGLGAMRRRRKADTTA